MPRVKRGLSGLSLVVGVNKPAGMSSHDAVSYTHLDVYKRQPMDTIKRAHLKGTIDFGSQTSI